MLVLSWQLQERHRSLLFMQLFTTLPHYVSGTKYALGIQATVSIIHCQHDFNCTQGLVIFSLYFRAPLRHVQTPQCTRYHSSRVWSVFLKCLLPQSKVSLCSPLDSLHPVCKEHLWVPHKLLKLFIGTRPKL